MFYVQVVFIFYTQFPCFCSDVRVPFSWGLVDRSGYDIYFLSTPPCVSICLQSHLQNMKAPLCSSLSPSVSDQDIAFACSQTHYISYIPSDSGFFKDSC